MVAVAEPTDAAALAKQAPLPIQSVIVHLVVDNAAAALDFYRQAFGAIELERHPSPDGQHLWHAAITLGTTTLFLSDDFSDEDEPMPNTSPKKLGGTSVMLYVYVADADTVFNQAVAAGAEVLMPLENMFWGDRFGKVRDPFGHHWAISQRLHQQPG